MSNGNGDKRPYERSGLYTRIEENALDGRTTVAKLIKELKNGLQEYVGETTIASEMLIQRIIYKHIRLSAYENSFIECEWVMRAVLRYVRALRIRITPTDGIKYISAASTQTIAAGP